MLKNALKCLYEKSIFCKKSHFYLNFPPQFTFKMRYFDKNRKSTKRELVMAFGGWKIYYWTTFWQICHFVAIFGVPRPCVVPSSNPTQTLTSACGSPFPSMLSQIIAFAIWADVVDSKPKGYFWEVCGVNLGLKIKTFDKYLSFGQRKLLKNALKCLYEKSIFFQKITFLP